MKRIMLKSLNLSLPGSLGTNNFPGNPKLPTSPVAPPPTSSTLSQKSSQQHRAAFSFLIFSPLSEYLCVYSSVLWIIASSGLTSIKIDSWSHFPIRKFTFLTLCNTYLESMIRKMALLATCIIIWWHDLSDCLILLFEFETASSCCVRLYYI